MKTFELTQEQIKKLAEKKHAKELLQQFIPEAFETKLEVGRWYKSKNKSKKTLFFTNKEKCDNDVGYGFDFIGKYYGADFNLEGSDVEDFELATEEEVSEALINEAKKRGFNNIGNLKIKNIYGGISNTLQLDGGIIFKDGKWAEIIEPTKEEINRVLTFLKKQNEQ